jgi:hypothetical protein
VAKVGRSATEADKCSAKYSECKAQGSSFDADTCTQLRVLKSELVDPIVECLSKPCPQIKDCIKGVVKNRGVDKCVDT